jgi:hypothetical protein
MRRLVAYNGWIAFDAAEGAMERAIKALLLSSALWNLVW